MCNLSNNYGFGFEDENEPQNYSNYLTYLKKLYGVKKLEISKDIKGWFITTGDIKQYVPIYEDYMKMIHRDQKITNLLNGSIE